jgi:hypothetical protein
MCLFTEAFICYVCLLSWLLVHLYPSAYLWVHQSCLRPSLGRFEYSGDWSDASSKWTPALIKELNVTFDSNDGRFWMSYDDFKRFFSGVSICHLYPPTSGNGSRVSTAPSTWFEVRKKGTFRVASRKVRTRRCRAVIIAPG